MNFLNKSFSKWSYKSHSLTLSYVFFIFSCPAPVVIEVCQNGTLFLVTEQYIQNAEGSCQKSLDKRKLPELGESIVCSSYFNSWRKFYSLQ